MKENNLYFLWGKEYFMINQEIKRIAERLSELMGEEPEIVYFDTDELSPRELREQLEFSPLFALQRVAVIKRPYCLGKGKKRGDKSEDFIKVINDYLDNASGGQILVLTSNQNEKSNPLVKRLLKEAEVIECKNPAPNVLGEWVKDEFADRDCSCTAGVVRRLVNSGQDMYYLYNLVEKLCLQVKNRAINEKDIEEELTNSDEIKVFKLTDALLRRNLKGAMAAFHQLLEQGEHPLLFLTMIARQFAGMAKVKAYQERGYNNKKIAELNGMKDFMVRKFAESGRLFSWEEIEQDFSAFLDVDIDIKSTSKDNVILMETLILEICTRK